MASSRGVVGTMTQAYLQHKTNDMRNDLEMAVLVREDHDDHFDDEYEHDDTSQQPKRTSEQAVISMVVMILATGTVLLDIMYMVLLGRAIPYASGIVSSLVCGWVILSQWKLEHMETLRTVHNRLRHDVNRMTSENERLTTSIDELSTQCNDLKEAERRLKDIANDQDLNVKALGGLIQDNRSTITHMKRTIRQDIISELMGVVLKGERDESGDFSDKELQRLCIYMRGLPAVKVNESLLKAAVGKDRCMYSLMTLIMDIAKSGTQDGDHIFLIDEDDKELQQRVMDRAS